MDDNESLAERLCKHLRTMDEPNGWTVCVDCEVNITQWSQRSVLPKLPTRDALPNNQQPAGDVAGLIERLRRISRDFHMPPSHQNMRNLNAIEAADDAADMLERLAGVGENDYLARAHGQIRSGASKENIELDRHLAQQTQQPGGEQVEQLREDFRRIASGEAEPVASCENCEAWLLHNDDFVMGEDVSGCWAGVTDDHTSAQSRPCYAYRVGKPDARAAIASLQPPSGEPALYQKAVKYKTDGEIYTNVEPAPPAIDGEG